MALCVAARGNTSTKIKEGVDEGGEGDERESRPRMGNKRMLRGPNARVCACTWVHMRPDSGKTDL